MSSYRVPCGRTTGHGEYCVEGWLCDACVKIEALRTALAAARDARDIFEKSALWWADRAGDRLAVVDAAREFLAAWDLACADDPPSPAELEAALAALDQSEPRHA